MTMGGFGSDSSSIEGAEREWIFAQRVSLETSQTYDVSRPDDVSLLLVELPVEGRDVGGDEGVLRVPAAKSEKQKKISVHSGLSVAHVGKLTE